MLRPEPLIDRVYLHRAPIDMRKQRNGLAALVQDVSPDQQMLFNEAEVLAAIAAADEKAGTQSVAAHERKAKPGPKPIPDKFPRKQVMHDVPESDKALRERREQAGQNFSLDEVLQIRQEKGVPIAEAFKKWLDDVGPGVTPTSALGKAIAYSLSQWPKLVRYLEHPEISPDNNRVEQAIRPFAVRGVAHLERQRDPQAIRRCPAVDHADDGPSDRPSECNHAVNRDNHRRLITP